MALEHLSQAPQQGGNSWGGWGGHSPQLLANNTFWGGFHTPLTSEVVLMGSIMSVCQSDMVMSDKTGIVEVKTVEL